MNRDLSDMREHYDLAKLEGNNILKDPFEMFDLWFLDAQKSDKIEEPNAFGLATINSDGFPDSRILLLKEYSKKGFVFYTNYKSKKGKDIEANPKVSALFLWKGLHRQVRILGSVTKISQESSNAYYQSRPRESQLGAWASKQSQTLVTRKLLEKNYSLLNTKFEGKEIPRPEHWGGYRLDPVKIEFWQGRTSRLHDRIVYEKENSIWNWNRLYP